MQETATLALGTLETAPVPSPPDKYEVFRITLRDILGNAEDPQRILSARLVLAPLDQQTRKMVLTGLDMPELRSINRFVYFEDLGFEALTEVCGLLEGKPSAIRDEILTQISDLFPTAKPSMEFLARMRRIVTFVREKLKALGY